jgi:hypothetical protein
MHVRTVVRMLRAAWRMWRDERTLGSVLAVVLVGIVVVAYGLTKEGEGPETSRSREETAR